MTIEIQPGEFNVSQFASLGNCRAIELHNYSAIYFLCEGATVVYVGQAKNLGSRIHHHSGKKIFDRVMAMPVPKEMLNAVEKHWVQQLQPKYNGVHNGGKPLVASIQSGVTKAICFSAPKELAPRLDAAAKRLGRSRSSYLIWLIQRDFQALEEFIERENKRP